MDGTMADPAAVVAAAQAPAATAVTNGDPEGYNGGPGGNGFPNGYGGPPNDHGPQGGAPGHSWGHDRVLYRPRRRGEGPPGGGPPYDDGGGDSSSVDSSWHRRRRNHSASTWPWNPDGSSTYARRMRTSLHLHPSPKPWQWKEWVVQPASEICRLISPHGPKGLGWIAKAENLEGIPDTAMQKSDEFPRLGCHNRDGNIQKRRSGVPGTRYPDERVLGSRNLQRRCR